MRRRWPSKIGIRMNLTKVRCYITLLSICTSRARLGLNWNVLRISPCELWSRIEPYEKIQSPLKKVRTYSAEYGSLVYVMTSLFTKSQTVRHERDANSRRK